MNTQIDERVRESMGALGVQIFFAITGFLFTRKALAGPVDIAQLIESRVRRIVPLYLVAVTASIAVLLYVLHVAHQPTVIRVSELLRAYLFGFTALDASNAPVISGQSIAGQAGQMWTLAWEWRFYALVPFLAIVLARRTWAISSFLLVTACAVVGAVDAGNIPAWVSFIPGILAAIAERRVKVSPFVSVALNTIGCVAYVVALTSVAFGTVQTGFGAIGFVALLLGRCAPLSARPLRLLGEVSYSIYMWHLIVASLYITYTHSAEVYLLYDTPEHRLPLALACVAALFALSFASYALIERPFLARTVRRERIHNAKLDEDRDTSDSSKTRA